MQPRYGRRREAVFVCVPIGVPDDCSFQSFYQRNISGTTFIAHYFISVTGAGKLPEATGKLPDCAGWKPVAKVTQQKLSFTKNS
jgi:hypothetical protein